VTHFDGNTTPRRTTPHRGEIELRHVTFAYPTRPDKMVCKDYSLKIEAGKTFALCGPSGEGKSTIMSLVLRFYDPLAGGVFLDGVPYQDINLKSLRASIGYVGQEPVLFSGACSVKSCHGGRADGCVVGLDY
jgi:ATP-binding cassette, subfamily B (MDR/TAP), member 1